MPTIAEIRQLYPSSADLSDHEIVQRLGEATGMGTQGVSDYLGYKPSANAWKDTAIDAGKGLVGLGQVVTGAANLVTGGRSGKAIRNTFGGDLEDVKQGMGKYYSGARQVADQEVANAEGFVGTAKAMLSNPRALAGTVAEGLPSMLAPAGLAYKAGKAGLSLAGVNAVNTGAWATITGTQIADRVNHEQPENVAGMYKGAAMGALATGALTHGFSLLPGGHMAASAGGLKGRAQGMANEGVMSGTEGAVQTASENVAMERPWEQGVSKGIAAGLVGGAAMGWVGAGGRHQPAAGDANPLPLPTTPEAIQLPEVMYGAPDGQVMNADQADAYSQYGKNLQELPPDTPAPQQDPAAAQLAATKAGKTAGKPYDPGFNEDQRTAIYKKYGEPAPNMVKHPEKGEVQVGHHFDTSDMPDKNGRIIPLTSPDKIDAHIAKLVKADAEKGPGQLAAEQSLSDAVLAELGRRPRSKELEKVGKEIDLAHTSDPVQLVGHIDVALAKMEGKKNPDMFLKDALTIWRKTLDQSDSLVQKVDVSKPEKKDVAKAPEAKQAAPQGPQAPVAVVPAAPVAPPAPAARVVPGISQALGVAGPRAEPGGEAAPAALQQALAAMVPKQEVALTDTNGKTSVMTPQQWRAKVTKPNEKDRLGYLVPEDGSPPLTFAQIAMLESQKYGKKVGATAIGNWAKKLGITKENVDAANAMGLNTVDAAELDIDGEASAMRAVANPNSSSIVNDDANMTGAMKRTQREADEILAKSKSTKVEEVQTADEQTRAAELAERRQMTAEFETMKMMHEDVTSALAPAAKEEYRILRTSAKHARWESLTEMEQAGWIRMYRNNEAMVLRGEDNSLEQMFNEFQKDLEDVKSIPAADRNLLAAAVPADPAVRRADPAGSTKVDAVQPRDGDGRSDGPGSREVVRSDDAEGRAAPGDAVQAKDVPAPVVAVKKRRVAVKQAQESTGKANPDLGKMTPLAETQFKDGAEAANYLAKNVKDGYLRTVAQKLAPYLKDVEVKFLKVGDKVHPQVAQRLNNQAMAVATVNATGKVEVWVRADDTNAMTQEVLLHELVHAATMKRLKDPAMRREVEALAKQVQDTMRRQGDEFFSGKDIFGSADEFMAYGLTSPTFQNWMKRLDANGNWVYKDSGARTDFVPQMTMWGKFVDAVRKMLGLAPVYQKAIDKIITRNKQVTENYENNKLENRLQKMLDDVLATKETDDGAPQSLAASRSITDTNIRRLPAQLQKPVRSITTTIHQVGTRAAQASAFMHDLADWATKHGMPTMKKIAKVMAQRGAYKVEQDRALGKLAEDFSSMDQKVQKQVQQFLHDSTVQQKWGYQPTWRDEVKIDPEAEKHYNQLSPEARAQADAMLRHGDEVWKEKQKAIHDLAHAHVTDEVSKATAEGRSQEEIDAIWKDLEKLIKPMAKMDGPYVPLKRFGNYIVTLKSQALLDAEATDRKKYNEMLSDPAHYRREDFDSAGRAEARATELEGDNLTVEWSEKEAHTYLGAGHEVLQRLADAAQERLNGREYSDEDRKYAGVLARTLNEAIIQSLGEYNARSNTLQRKNVAGVNPEEIARAFFSQGFADNQFLASVKHNRELNDFMSQLRAEKDTGGDRTAKQNFYNEFQARQANNLKEGPAPWVGHAMRFTSLWKLVTLPAYYLQYISQPLTMFLPLVQGEHGGAKSWGALINSYKDMKRMARGLHDTDVSVLKDPNERKMIEDLTNTGTIGIGHEQTFGRIETLPSNGVSKVWAKATNAVTQLPHSLEMHNRIAASLAAYRLAVGKGMKHDDAVEYTRSKINQGFGDYSSYNAPRIMQGGSANKLIMQYRQFQLIHTALLVRLLNNAFKGESPDVRKAARAQMMYMAGHYGVLAGGLGIPGAHVIGGAIKAVFGDEDIDEDLETFVKRHAGGSADMILGGVPRAVFGQDLSSRMGAGDILSPFRGTGVVDALSSKKDYKDFTIAALGPFIGSMVPQVIDGVDTIQKGDYYRGLEQLMPTGVGAAMKAYRYADEGVVSKRGLTTTKAEDISGGDILAQALGSRPVSVTEPAHDAAMVGKIQMRFRDKSFELKNRFAKARKAGDDVASIVEEWKELNTRMKAAGLKPAPLSELYKAPQQINKRNQMMIDGVPYTKSTKGLVQNVTDDGEEE